MSWDTVQGKRYGLARDPAEQALRDWLRKTDA